MGCEKKQRAEMFREFGIIIFLSLLWRSEAELHIIDHPSLVEVSLGQNITLPCVLADSNQPELNLNPTTASVRWDVRSLNGNVHTVYLLTNGTHTAYRPKSHIEANNFSRGITSLSMSDVREGDEGEYTCSIYVTPYKITSETSLQVSARPTVTLTSSESAVKTGHEISVTCEISKFYPKFITIRWFKSIRGSNTRAALDKETCNSVPVENGDGTFNATSVIVIKPSSTDEDGDVYSCIVSHRSFNNDEAFNFTLTVKGLYTTSEVILKVIAIVLCLLLVAAMAWIFILYKRGPHKTYRVILAVIKVIAMVLFLLVVVAAVAGIVISHRREPHATSRVILAVIVILLFILLVAAVAGIVKSYRTDIITAHIIGPQTFKNGEEVTLTCEITKCDPRPLQIIWKKGKQIIFIDGNAKDSRYQHSGTLDVPHEHNMLMSSSSLTFKVSFKEDHGMKYTCMVLYLSKILDCHRDILVTAPPVVEQITSTDVGEQMELSCRIHSFCPKTIEIKWFKEDKVLPTADCKLRTGEDGLYSATAILMYIPDKEDFGKTFKCKVHHKGLPNPETHEWKLEELRRNKLNLEVLDNEECRKLLCSSTKDNCEGRNALELKVLDNEEGHKLLCTSMKDDYEG